MVLIMKRLLRISTLMGLLALFYLMLTQSHFGWILTPSSELIRLSYPISAPVFYSCLGIIICSIFYVFSRLFFNIKRYSWFPVGLWLLTFLVVSRVDTFVSTNLLFSIEVFKISLLLLVLVNLIYDIRRLLFGELHAKSPAQ